MRPRILACLPEVTKDWLEARAREGITGPSHRLVFYLFQLYAPEGDTTGRHTRGHPGRGTEAPAPAATGRQAFPARARAATTTERHTNGQLGRSAKAPAPAATGPQAVAATARAAPGGHSKFMPDFPFKGMDTRWATTHPQQQLRGSGPQSSCTATAASYPPRLGDAILDNVTASCSTPPDGGENVALSTSLP